MQLGGKGDACLGPYLPIGDSEAPAVKPPGPFPFHVSRRCCVICRKSLSHLR